MAVAFNAHDEYFNPDPQFPPKRMMAIHPVEELLAYARPPSAQGKARSRMLPHRRILEPRIRPQAGYLKEKAYTTLFLGWPGGTWTPPTEKALIYMVDHLPKNCIWNVSVMYPQKQWDLLSLAVSLGGHVRVGYEDNPYIAPGELAKNNAALVERMVKIAQGLGRAVATPKRRGTSLGLAASN